jgi:hypothetical protein
MKRGIIVAALMLAVLCFAACAPGANSLKGTPAEGGKIAGFWMGLWHGLIAPIAFIVSIFNRAVNVYEVHNSGIFYNLGFIRRRGGKARGAGEWKKPENRVSDEVMRRFVGIASIA